jgi:hypothetical protein
MTNGKFIGIGIGLGTILGLATDNVGFGIATGLGLSALARLVFA